MDKKYDFTEAEKKMQELWEKEGIYTYQNGRDKKVFSIDTPPPTVSGSLHIGHVFSYTQAEIIARYKRMQGFDVFYPFGFDDNGLPTERLVEREGNIRAGEVNPGEFYKKCLDTVKNYEEEFIDMWKSLGFSVDWNLTYQTISEKSRRISQRSFLELAKKGKAYRKESPVLWCTECRTSIAQAELDSKDTESVFYYLSFGAEPVPLIIATTRPELLYGCVCIFVNPSDERYRDYIGLSVKVPLYDFEIPVMADEGVSMEKGTGAVMCATFGDATDVEWYQKYQLPYKKVVTEEGRISADVPFIGGMGIKGARKEIIMRLKEKGLVIKEEPIIHTVGIHERCKTEIEIVPSAQWYIDITTEKEKFLKAADEINWYPQYMKNRYRIWVENLKWDWCISRQRYFGVPFPVWYCKKCHKPILAEEWQLPVNPLEDKPPHPCDCGCGDFSEVIPETAVFDTWATSSVTPFINSGFGEREDTHSEIFPMGMRSQAHEIIRTWAFYTIVKSIYHTGQIPWKDIMVSGFVLAKPGEKLSKSQNNASLSPAFLIRKHSADAIRYWAANAKLGTDTFFTEEELKISKRFLTKLYNAANFCIMHLEDYKKEGTAFLPVDRWILQRVSEAARQAQELLEHYEIGQARHVIDELFWRDFCDDYIEIVKERLYQPQKHGERERQSGQYALYHSLLGILKLYAIYTPHMTEYIYQQFFCSFEPEMSLHQTLWNTEAEDRDILEFGQRLQTVIGEVRRRKAEKQLSMKEEVEELIITAPPHMARYFESSEKDIKACTGAKKIIVRS
ncbi:valine--tRNA ligase [Anaerocolumna xylanovorans]|uniref:Valine--tRNA ligase n=1 Tax=Anaerocolumna xylanovorans DSM 12503 TaxID=1121345 RepID=A0A1M7Y992_9FIRM|nr:valine--tRNA ligase [Anaerocolumna xylanovorans]SHO49169.1 valyl-tRNA synthetase [Anaerocolumna xylanovorans DSM 12503]